MINDYKSKLQELCLGLPLKDTEISENSLDLVLDKYPYAPYIPEDWNGYLVVAEAQQLNRNSQGNSVYVDGLLLGTVEELIFRLNNQKFNTGKVGITPWDDGHIKLAMLSCFPEINLDQVAVANAVPWFLNKTNTKQDKFLKKRSIEYWSEILDLLNGKLKCVIRTGEYARAILDYYKLKNKNIEKIFSLRSASQLERVSYVFDTDDLLNRYKEVENALSTERFSYDKKIKAGLVFYAAHAVSTINKK